MKPWFARTGGSLSGSTPSRPYGTGIRARTKFAIVCAGYGLAIVAGCAASFMYNARMAEQPYDTSGGMYAFGELLTGLGMFLLVAAVPTFLAVWFLRQNARLWHWIAVGSFAFAVVGLLAVLMPLVVRGNPNHPALVLLSLVGLAQLLGVPLWTVAFLVFAIIAPTRPARRLLKAAVGIELVIGVCAAVHWFVPRPPF